MQVGHTDHAHPLIEDLQDRLCPGLTSVTAHGHDLGADCSGHGPPGVDPRWVFLGQHHYPITGGQRHIPGGTPRSHSSSPGPTRHPRRRHRLAPRTASVGAPHRETSPQPKSSTVGHAAPTPHPLRCAPMGSRGDRLAVVKWVADRTLSRTPASRLAGRHLRQSDRLRDAARPKSATNRAVGGESD